MTYKILLRDGSVVLMTNVWKVLREAEGVGFMHKEGYCLAFYNYRIVANVIELVDNVIKRAGEVGD